MTRTFNNKEEVHYYGVALEDYRGSWPCPSVKVGDVIELDEEHANEVMTTGLCAFNYDDNGHWCIALVKAKVVKETISQIYEDYGLPE